MAFLRRYLMQFNGLARKLAIRQSNLQEQVECEGKNKGFGVI